MNDKNKARSDKILRFQKAKVSVTEEAYNQLDPIVTRFVSKTKNRTNSPEKINISSPQINRSVFNKMDSCKRSKVLQIACEAPDVLNLFHTRKLFANDDSTTSTFIKKTVDINNFEEKNKNLPVFREKSAKKMDFRIGDIKFALENLKNFEAFSKQSKKSLKSSDSKVQSKKNMCFVIENIVNNLESLRNDCKSAERFDASIEKEQKKMNNFTSRMKWTANSLQK